MEVQTNGVSYRKARTERNRIKPMAYIQYIQQCWKEKRENHNKTIDVCQLHNRRVFVFVT